MGQQNALARLGEPRRQRQGVTRALGAVDGDDERSGVGHHDGTHAPVRPRLGRWGHQWVLRPPAPHRSPTGVGLATGADAPLPDGERRLHGAHEA